MNPTAPPAVRPQRPPPPSQPQSAPRAEPKPATNWAISSGTVKRPNRVIVVGDGGVGKTTLLASLCPIDRNLGVLVDFQGGSNNLNCQRVDAAAMGFEELRQFLRSSALDPYSVVCIDPMTVVEERGLEWTLANVPHPDKGHKVDAIEGYGFGKGYHLWHETMQQLPADLDRLVERGKHVVLACHGVASTVPNPDGEDYLRWEMRLYAGNKKGQDSTRNLFFEWADHVLFLASDIAAKGGKARGGTTRTLHVSQNAAWAAKSRSLRDDIPCDLGSTAVWEQLGIMPAAVQS